MVRPKTKKQPGRGIDFKKIKRKVGRKLPPPNNTTNTEIKSKAIILPEQSVASDKVGLAVSKKGLTLKELLQHTSHHNVKVRKDALLGIRELLLKYETELKLHKLAIIEKLRERINDEDKVVRETLYQLFKSVILPGCQEDNQGALISLVMAYILNAMTHLSIDVRLMAFKFFDLVVQHYPSAFSSFAEKVLDNFMDILQKNQFHLEDKGKFKIALSGLVRCLSLLPNEEVNSSGQDIAEKHMLHGFDPDLPKDSTGHIPVVVKLKDVMPVLVNCFDGLISAVNSQPVLDSQSFDCMLSILQSIDLIVQYFVYAIGKYEEDEDTSTPYRGSLEICKQDKKFHSLLLDKLFARFPMQPLHHLSQKDDHRYFIVNAAISQTFFTFSRWICPTPALLHRFLQFLVDVLFKIYSGDLSGKAFHEKHLLSLVPFIPKLISTVDWDWKRALLQAFTLAFGHCNPESAMKMACLKAVEEMLLSKQQILYTNTWGEELLDHQRTWIREIVMLLISLGNRKPSHSHAVLHLQLRLGQIGLSNSILAEEYDKMQDELQKYYCISTKNGQLCYGPFMDLSLDSQEISICCLYYFSSLKQQLLASLALCSLSLSLEPRILFRIIEVLHSAYRAGRIQIADYVSFFITLLSQYEIIPGTSYSEIEKEGMVSNQVTFRSVTGVVCSFLSQIGDQSLVLRILEEAVLDLTSRKLPLENTCALMRMLVTLDSKPKQLSEKSINILCDILLSYLIDVALLFPEDDKECKDSNNITRRYYLLPCYFMMDRSTTLLERLIDKMGSATAESCEIPFLRDTQVKQDHIRRVKAIISVISMMCKDVKMQRILPSYKAKIDNILQRILLIQSSMVGNISIEQQDKVQCGVDRLKYIISEICSMLP